MVTSRADRRAGQEPRAREAFGAHAGVALQVLDLLDLAWHDCYGDTTPPERVMEDVWLVAGGDLAGLVSAAHLAVLDFRDLRVSADTRRAQG